MRCRNQRMGDREPCRLRPRTFSRCQFSPGWVSQLHFVRFPRCCSRPASSTQNGPARCLIPFEGAPRLPKNGRRRSFPGESILHPRHSLLAACHAEIFRIPSPHGGGRWGPGHSIPPAGSENSLTGDEEEHRWGRSRNGSRYRVMIARATRGKRLTRRLSR